MLIVIFLTGQVGSDQIPVSKYVTGIPDIEQCTVVRMEKFPSGKMTEDGLIVGATCIEVKSKSNQEAAIPAIKPVCGSKTGQDSRICSWDRVPL